MENLVIPTMLSISECAEKTNMSKSSIRRLCYDNKIKFIRVGVKYLVNMDTLVDYLNDTSK